MFDGVMKVHENALRLRESRSELLTQNIANADTPGYKARDIDFHEVLSQSINSGDLKGSSSDQNYFYRIPNQPSLDGNTVDEHLEQAEFSKNSLEYMTSLELLRIKFSGLTSVIRGE